MAAGPPLYGHRVFPRDIYHVTRAPRLPTLLEGFLGDPLEGPCLLGPHLTHRECAPRGTGHSGPPGTGLAPRTRDIDTTDVLGPSHPRSHGLGWRVT